MKERPILFSGEMVRAILAGQKTQTRRVVKTPRCMTSDGPMLWDLSRAWADNGYLHVPFAHPSDGWQKQPADDTVDRVYAPWEVGDRLWVREAFSAWFSGYHWCEMEKEFRTYTYASNVFYRATHNYPDDDQKWVPSIFLPRWASRITLEITDVRVQRLRDIQVPDCAAEGAPRTTEDGWDSTETFRELWDSINAKRGFGWDVNPWVWAITFKRI